MHGHGIRLTCPPCGCDCCHRKPRCRRRTWPRARSRMESRGGVLRRKKRCLGWHGGALRRKRHGQHPQGELRGCPLEEALLRGGATCATATTGPWEDGWFSLGIGLFPSCSPFRSTVDLFVPFCLVLWFLFSFSVTADLFVRFCLVSWFRFCNMQFEVAREFWTQFEAATEFWTQFWKLLSIRVGGQTKKNTRPKNWLKFYLFSIR